MQYMEMTEQEVDLVSGAGFWSGVGTAMDYAGRGALVGGMIGFGIGSAPLAAAGGFIGAVYGAGLSVFMEAN
ncbi:hypothetical protein [Janthinobacterium sp. MDT1-19]|uniref:hypothetical protein n=1 Tax=Janthinobacterium sp. MDT1-19 TaxID=1259339 RepID=UPI003F207D0D